MLSKAMGQILRVSADMHILFNAESDDIPENISQMAIDAAIDFVEVCCQHTAFITGRGNIDEQLHDLDTGKLLHSGGGEGVALRVTSAFNYNQYPRIGWFQVRLE